MWVFGWRKERSASEMIRLSLVGIEAEKEGSEESVRVTVREE